VTDRLPGAGERARREFALANQLASQGRFGEAVTYYAIALSLNPRLVEARNNLGLAYSALGNTAKAIASLKESLSRKPDYVAAHSNLLLALNSAAELSPGRLIRLGYVSSDFRQHSVAAFIEPVLKCHDRNQFGIFWHANHPRLALDPDRLRELRRNLRPRMAAAPLTDASSFTADLERAYRAMWADWCLIPGL
jgi:predicted O-linked N-acetylglucosamine transferase (SPINDLY family)